MSFDLQSILKGELLKLRPLRPEDFHDLYAVASDPLIWEQHPSNDRYREDVFKGFFREALESEGALIAIDAKNGRIIGSSRFHAYNSEKSEIEIGWTFLARSYWGGAYNREMKQLMLRHAFQFVKSVIFIVGTRNFRSQKAVEKIGGVRVGTRRDDARGYDNFVYQITAASFEQESAAAGGGSVLTAPYGRGSDRGSRLRCAVFRSRAHRERCCALVTKRRAYGCRITFISPGSRAYSRSNHAGPSASGATALINGSTRMAPRASKSMQVGYSPDDAQEPNRRSWRVTTACNGSSIFGAMLPTSVSAPPLRSAAMAV